MSIPTLAEIKDSLPRHVDAKLFDHDPDRNISQETMAKKLYGPYVRQLTRGIIKRFMGKTLTILQGQNWPEKTIGNRVRQLQKLRPLHFDDEQDHLWSDWIGKEGIQDYIYFDGDVAVTGSGADPIFVFLKGKTSTTKTKSTSTACSSLSGRPRERNATTGRCKLTKVTKRFRVKDGKRIAEAVPKTKHGRKAPAGHAKDYKNKKAVGLDGGIWISKPVPKTGVYRWIKA